MAFRRPLVIKGDALHEMSDSDIALIRNRVIVNHGRDQGFRLSVVNTNGTLNSMNDTRKLGGAVSNVDSAQAGPVTTNTITFQRILDSVDGDEYISDTTKIDYPIYFESDGNPSNIKVRAMTDSDFRDTFIRPVINDLVDGTTGNNRQGVYFITQDSTAAGVLSTVPVFIDTIFDANTYAGGFAGNLNLPEDSDQPVIEAKYYLGKVPTDSSLAPLNSSNYFPMLRIDPDSGGSGTNSHIRLKEMDSATLDHYLLTSLNYTEAFDSHGYKLRYAIDSANDFAGNQVGTAITDKSLLNQKVFSGYGAGGYAYGDYFQYLPYGALGDSAGGGLPGVVKTYKLKIRRE